MKRVKNIEKLFADKLKNHKTEPSPEAWIILEQALNQNSGKRAFPLLKIAAAIVLLLLATVVIVQWNDASEDRSADKTVPPTEKYAKKQEKQNLNNNEATTQENKIPQPMAEYDKKPANGQPEPERLAQKNVPEKLKKHPVNQLVPSVQPEQQALAEVPSVEKLRAPDKIANTAPGLQEYRVETKSLLALASPAPASETITIIYKSQEPEAQPDLKKKNRFFEVVQEIRSGDLSLAELRNAKNDLIASAIDKIGREK